MAVFLDRRGGTRTIRNTIQEDQTTQLPESLREDDDENPPTREDRTAAHVRRKELGDRKVKDEYDAPDETSNGTGKTALAVAARKEIAKTISTAISKLMKVRGTVKMAAGLALLKRELSNAHDKLAGFSSESDFVSIIVLVESELGVKPWKEISKSELEALKSTIDVGVNSSRVSFDDFNRAAHTLSASGWTTGPSIELGNDEDDFNEKEPSE